MGAVCKPAYLVRLQFSDGNPRNIFWMGTLSRIGHTPPFFLPFQKDNLTGHASGARTDEPPSSYGAVDRSINSGVPFGRGRGCLSDG